MRLKHTPYEIYNVYSLFANGSGSWFPYKHYSTKQGALSAIKKAKEKNNNLVWKIVWCPYPFASEEECITVYNEDQEV